jgi:hypothetical protein
MDEAFIPLHGIIQAMAPADGDVRDEELGVHSYIFRFEIESPVELDVSRDRDGALQIGSAPPLYYVDTSLRPAYHRMRFSCELTKERDAG